MSGGIMTAGELKEAAEAKRQEAENLLELARQAERDARIAQEEVDREARKARYEAEKLAKVAKAADARAALLLVAKNVAASIPGSKVVPSDMDNQADYFVRISLGDRTVVTANVDLNLTAVEMYAEFSDTKRYPRRKDGDFSWDKIAASLKAKADGKVNGWKAANDADLKEATWHSAISAELLRAGAANIATHKSYHGTHTGHNAAVTAKLNGTSITITQHSFGGLASMTIEKELPGETMEEVAAHLAADLDAIKRQL